jgi:hypothetical protein
MFVQISADHMTALPFLWRNDRHSDRMNFAERRHHIKRGVAGMESGVGLRGKMANGARSAGPAIEADGGCLLGEGSVLIRD